RRGVDPLSAGTPAKRPGRRRRCPVRQRVRGVAGGRVSARSPHGAARRASRSLGRPARRAPRPQPPVGARAGGFISRLLGRRVGYVGAAGNHALAAGPAGGAVVTESCWLGEDAGACIAHDRDHAGQSGSLRPRLARISTRFFHFSNRIENLGNTLPRISVIHYYGLHPPSPNQCANKNVNFSLVERIVYPEAIE